MVKIRNSTWKPRLGSNVPCTTADHDPADPGEPAGQQPDPGADALHVDAGDGREVPVVGDGPHRLAERGPGEQEGDGRRRHGGDRDRHGLPGRDADEAEVEHGALVDAELADLRAGDDEDDVADHEPEADGDERGRHQPPAAQRPQHEEVHRERQERGGQHGAQRRDHEVLPVDRVEHEPDIGGEGQELALGEVRDPLDAEHQRGTHPGERQDGAGDQAVDRELGQLLQHRPALAVRTGGPGRLRAER